MPAAAQRSRDLRDGIDGGHPRRPDRRDDRTRVLGADQIGSHAERVVGRHLAQLELEEPGRFLAHGVRVLGADENATIGAQRARDDGGGEHAGRGRVLDVACELLREADELPQPVDGQLLELLERG